MKTIFSASHKIFNDTLMYQLKGKSCVKPYCLNIVTDHHRYPNTFQPDKPEAVFFVRDKRHTYLIHRFHFFVAPVGKQYTPVPIQVA